MKLFQGLIALVIACILGLLIYFINSDQSSPSLTPNNGDDVTVQGQEVLLYYYKQDEDTDETGNILCSADSVQAVTRDMDHYSIADHIQLLLAGPSDVEQAQGFSSEFPLSGFTLESSTLSDNGVLVLRFDDPENQTSGGSCRVSLLSTQLIKTLETIPGVHEIRIDPEDLFQP